MPTGVADLIVLGAVLFYAVQGLSNGAFWSVMQAVQFTVPLTVAFAFYVPLARLLTAVKLSEPQAVFAAFAVIFIGGGFGIRQALAAHLPEDGIHTYKIVDKLIGLAIGCGAGAVLSSAVLILWSMAPLAPQLTIDMQQVRVDMGAKALMQFKSLNASVGAGDFMLEGEPAAGADAENQTPGAQEPYVDRNADEQWNEGEPYVEVVHDKAYTGSFDFVDQNANELWDMGVRNMYLVGRWSLPQ